VFEAQLKHKLTRQEEDLEDLLTSNVFGLFKYAPSGLGLIPFLKSARNLQGNTIPILNKIRTAKYDFWPWVHVNTKYGCEPDVLITCLLEDGSECLILIEAKYLSGKSSFADDTSDVTDQLAREMANLMGLAKKIIISNFYLIYVTVDTAFPRLELEASIKELLEDTGFNSAELIYWVPWQILPTLIQKLVDELDDPLKGMYEDLRSILLEQDLYFFDGIHSQGWTLGKPAWSFQIPKERTHYSWCPITTFRYAFKPFPRIFSLHPGPRPGMIDWRWKNGNI